MIRVLPLLNALLIIFSMAVSNVSLAGAREDARRAYNEQDYATAHDLWKQLAKQGDRDAQFSLGVMFSLGNGQEKDSTKAFEWFSKAAEGGHVKAMYNLGIAYYTGEGALQDQAEAIHWWRKAAERGDAKSQFNLGISYYNGAGVEKDLVAATRWVRSAAENQYPTAQEILPKLEQQLRETSQTASAEEPAEVTSSTPNTTAEAEPAPAGEDSTTDQESVSEAKQANDSAPQDDEPTKASEPKYVEVDFTAGVIKTDAAPVYAENAKKSPVIEKLGSGTPVIVVEQNKGWSKIRLAQGIRVWVYGTYVVGSGDDAKINGKGVRARPLPSTAKESVVVGTFNNNDTVRLLKTDGKWKQVRAPEHLTAWIDSNHVTVLKQPTEAWMDRWEQMKKQP